MIKSVALKLEGENYYPQLYLNEFPVLISHYTGETFGGGVIVQIWSGGTHGIIANDISAMPWGCRGYYVSGLTLSDGKYNTMIIARDCPTSHAAYVSGRTLYGYNDWYIPTYGNIYQVAPTYISTITHTSGSTMAWWSSNQADQLGSPYGGDGSTNGVGCSYYGGCWGNTTIFGKEYSKYIPLLRDF